MLTTSGAGPAGLGFEEVEHLPLVGAVGDVGEVGGTAYRGAALAFCLAFDCCFLTVGSCFAPWACDRDGSLARIAHTSAAMSVGGRSMRVDAAGEIMVMFSGSLAGGVKSRSVSLTRAGRRVIRVEVSPLPSARCSSMSAAVRGVSKIG